MPGEARQSAEQWRAFARQWKDPIKEREKERREAERNLHCLGDVALDAFESRKAELKGDGKAGRWFSPLELHVLPKLPGLGSCPVLVPGEPTRQRIWKRVLLRYGSGFRQRETQTPILIRRTALV